MSGRACAWHVSFVALLLVFLASGAAFGQANVQGQWTTLTNTVPINPIHVALLPTGKLLVIAGSGNCPPSQAGCPSGAPYGPPNGSGALLLDPTTGETISQFTLSWDMFCNDMVLLEDGRVFIAGGTIQYDPFYGSPQAAIFDPQTNTFSNVQNMAHGRWYPTTLTLGDGRIMTYSGLSETGGTNTSVEFYSPDSGWSQQYPAPWTPDTYPRLHLLPSGKVLYTGAQPSSKLFDPSTQTWSAVATTNYSGMRTYGTSILLPLTPANNYDPRVIIMGGGNPATNTTEIIDMGSSTPAWHYGPNMSAGRIEMNAVILPNGKVLAVGGSVNDEDVKTASLNADLYDPVTNTFSPAGTNAYPRLYHSTALLLPDATVWLGGGNPTRGSYVPQMEIYKPGYLFNSDGSLATRPTISAAPSTISYGQAFSVSTPDAANISSVVLVRNGTVTHAFDKDQREVGMAFTTDSGTLTVTGPPNSNIAPPGYYMLFLLDNSGVPSVASFVNIAPAADFSIAVTPPSQNVSAGSGASFTTTVVPSNEFSGTVTLGVTGLPSGATATFSPASISGTGTSALKISTAASTPAGSYTLTISGSSGNLVHSSTSSLVVTSASGSSSIVNGSSQYRIINQSSGACIDNGGKLSSGSPLTQWRCEPGNKNQEWLFSSSGSPGAYLIASANASNGPVWTVTNGAKATNTPVQQATSTQAPYQQWSAQTLSTGYYQFVDTNSGLCLTVPGGAGTNGLQLQVSTCTGSPSQSFVLGSVSTAISSAGWYEILSAKSGMCITDLNSATAKGTPLSQATCGTLLNQEWQFQPTSNGYQAVYNGKATSLLWDDTGWSTANGNGIDLWTWSNNSNQDWTPTLLSNGLFTFSVLTSGKCLDNGGSTTSGSKMTQWTCQSTNTNQQYELVRVR